jgi:hypothetical protein
MLNGSHADLSQAFCSYCGYPPMGRWRFRAHRVCMRCGVGTVLRAPEGSQPRFDDPFLIVDEQLRLRAVSRHAEVVLMVREPAAINAPLEDFLISDNGDRGHIMHLAGLVEDAIAGSTEPAFVEMRTVSDPVIAVVARIAGCGPPPAALVTLIPVAPRAMHLNGRESDAWPPRVG